LLSLLTGICLISSLLTAGQQISTISSDTAAREPETIKISEISIKSGEMMIQIHRLGELMITDEEIEEMEVNNDLLMALLDSLFAIDRSIDLSTKSIRYLNNKLASWKKSTNVLEQEKSSLAGVVQNLDETKYDLGEDIRVWINTRTALEQEESEITTIQRIDKLIFQMDSVKGLVHQKSYMILTLLNRTTEKSVILGDYINEADKTLLNKSSEIFDYNQPSLFSIQLSDEDTWRLKGPMMAFYRMEIRELGMYLTRSIPNIVFQLILLILLVIAFKYIKQWILQAKINENSFHQQMLVRILSRSISAALILGLFASAVIFSNRPELFKDILKILVTIPLIIIGTTVLNRKFHIYLYLFGIAFFLQTVVIIFPPNHILYSAILVTIALIEMLLLGNLAAYFHKHSLSRKFLNKLVIVLLVIHFGFAFAGLIGVLTGAVILAEISLRIPISNVFIGLLVITTAIILNGLIEAGIESPYFRKLNIFRRYGNYLEERAIKIINFGAITLWLYFMLKIINIERPIVNGLTSFFTDKIQIGSASFSLGSIVLFFLIIWLSIIISKMIRIILEQDILDKFSLAKGVPHTIAVMVRYSLITIGVLLAVTAVGMPLDRLTILFGAFGVGIGFGLQNIFNNLVSGLILLFERPIQIGDTIEVGQLMGHVKSIGIRASNIRTFEGAEVIVPNGQLISNEVVNWTLSDQQRRIEVIAGVAYGSDPHKVRELLLKALEEHPEVIKDPSPNVFFNDLGENSLDFRLLFWTSNFDDWIRIRSDVLFKVYDVLKEAGIEIPFPQMDLHLRSVDPGIEIVNKGK